MNQRLLPETDRIEFVRLENNQLHPAHGARGSGRRGSRPLQWYSSAMRTTIDKAGRVVIPAAIRERAGLTAGAEIEITEEETGVRIERVAVGPRLVKVGRRLVARPSVPASQRPTIDIAAIIEEERNRWP